jgi:hypothetical protein
MITHLELMCHGFRNDEIKNELQVFIESINMSEYFFSPMLHQ